jgi:hypothetical protein
MQIYLLLRIGHFSIGFLAVEFINDAPAKSILSMERFGGKSPTTTCLHVEEISPCRSLSIVDCRENNNRELL